MCEEKSLDQRLSTATSFVFYWLPPAICAILIFYFSSSDTGQPSPFIAADKVFHLGAYALLGFLFARALTHNYLREKRYIFIIAVSACIIFGIGNELYQFLLPSRHPSVMDTLANSIGSFLGVGIYSKRRTQA
jgi:VanZ family protein